MLGLSNPELGVLMLALFVVFIMFGFPIAFTLMALGVLFGYFAMAISFSAAGAALVFRDDDDVRSRRCSSSCRLHHQRATFLTVCFARSSSRRDRYRLAALAARDLRSSRLRPASSAPWSADGAVGVSAMLRRADVRWRPGHLAAAVWSHSSSVMLILWAPRPGLV
jgi:hypothetical protein